MAFQIGFTPRAAGNIKRGKIQYVPWLLGLEYFVNILHCLKNALL